jgi:hypothetical protein
MVRNLVAFTAVFETNETEVSGLQFGQIRIILIVWCLRIWC